MRAAALALAAAVGLAACGGDDDDASLSDAGDPNAEQCLPTEQAGVYFDPDDPCRFLSSYRFFTNSDAAALAPNDRVVPYELNSTLFSDYSVKSRYIYLPDGETMSYDGAEAFDLPVGAAILKTFAYPERVIETRLLYRGDDGWAGLTYVWNDEQTEARLRVAGVTFDIAGETYLVPNINQCKECHEETENVVGPVGPKARHINRDFDYGAGAENQLQHLVDIGFLTGAPADPANTAPRAPVWDDDTTGTLDERARAYLDINCAHCHNPAGRARTSGLDLRLTNDDLLSYGVCKPPVAAGGGSGGRQYNIVPGDPDDSILVFRMESVEPDIQMPELGRTRVHTEAVAVIREWIAAMPGDCAVTE
jgi:uncharacterized repeat protein (TIGR03806 family)